MYSCVLGGQVCILGITLDQLIRVGSSFGRISQSCLFNPVFVLFHFIFLLKWAQGDRMKTGLGKLSGVLGISEISEPHRNIRNIGTTSATTPLLDTPDGPMLK